MSVSRSDVTVAIHWWCADPKNRSIDPSVPTLLNFLFTVLEALHIELQRVPASWDAARDMGIASAGTRGTYLGISGGDEYLIMRSILALATDIGNIADTLATTVPSEPLHSHAERLVEATEAFRDARNFFTHLDERLVNRDKHGIIGPEKWEIQVESEELLPALTELCKAVFGEARPRKWAFSIPNKPKLLRDARNKYIPCYRTDRDWSTPEPATVRPHLDA